MRQNSNEVWRGKIWGSSEAYFVSLYNFLYNEKESIVNILKNGGKIRILIAHNNSSFVSTLENREGKHRVGRIKEEINSTIELLRTISEEPFKGKASIELRECYGDIPSRMEIIDSGHIFWTPYLFIHSSKSLTFELADNRSKSFKNLTEYFERLWVESKKIF
jgi:hypothetical protein